MSTHSALLSATLLSTTLLVSAAHNAIKSPIPREENSSGSRLHAFDFASGFALGIEQLVARFFIPGSGLWVAPCCGK
jgi:hypothetical protein